MNKYTHLGVYGILIENNKVLLIKKARGPHKGKWDLPGGTIEFGEEPYTTLIREFEEETGITSMEGTIYGAKSYTMIYPYQDDELEELHHIGIIYSVTLLHDSYTLNVTGDGQDSDGARWFEASELNQLEITPFAEEVYQLLYT